MVDVHVVGPVRGVSQHAHIVAGQLVCAHQSLLVPIGPIDSVVKHRQSKDVRNLGAGQNNLTMFSIIIGKLDPIQMRVCPVDFVTEIINRQSVWPNKLVLVENNSLEIATIEPEASYEGLMRPIGEKQIANSRVDRQSSWIVDTLAEDCFAMPAIQFAYIQMLACPVNPIQLPSNPIHSQALQSLRIVPNDGLFACAVHENSMDCFVAHVGVVQTLLGVIVIQSDHILQIHLNQIVNTPIGAHVAQIVSIAKDKPRLEA